MPLWLIYGAEYLTAIALLVVALVLVLLLVGRLHFAAVDAEPFAGTTVTTHYFVVVGTKDDAELAVTVFLARRAIRHEQGLERLIKDLQEEDGIHV